MSATDRGADQQGLSLVEVMVALLILGLVLSALASALATSLRSVRGQEAATQGTAAINNILEEAQRVEYEEAVLCDTTATNVFGGTTFEGEDLVLSSAACGASDEVLPERTVTRDGREFDVRTAITWSDDPGDGTDAADDDTTQDIKRIVVDVTWSSDGQTRTARNLAYRAPQFLEQLVTGEVEPDDGSKFITITDDATDDGENAEAFTLRAHAREKLTSVQVRWVDRNGTTESHAMSDVGSDGLVWEYSLTSNFGPFANGGTLFEFEATSTTGETQTVAARGLFLYDPMAALSGGIQRNFTVLQISREDGAVCPGQAFWLDVEGAIRSDLGTASWPNGNGPSTVDPLVAVDAPPDVAVRGARFELDLSDRTDFATYDSSTDTYTIDNGTVQIRMEVERIVDATVLSKERDNIKVELVDAC